MNHWTRYSLQAASILLSLVSVVFSVALWSQLPTETWMKVISGLAGFALELCKFTLLPLSFLFLKNRKTTTGLLLLLIGGALLVVSVGASVTFLETGEQARQQQSVAWQQRQTSLSQLDERIAIGQQSAARDIEGGYRQRGLDTLAEVDGWQQQRETLLKKPVVQSLGLSGLDDQQRFYAWLLLAILIDGCAVAGWTLLSGQQRSLPAVTLPESTIEPVEVDSSCSPETFSETVTTRERTCESISETTSETTTVTVSQAIRERVVQGEFGHKFSIRHFMEKEKMGHRKAKPLLEGLVEEGVLIDTGRGYQVVGG